MKSCVAVLLTSVVAAALCSPVPFYWLDKYIDEYLEEIRHLKHVSHEYHPHHEPYIAEHYDEKLAAKEAEEYDFIVVGSGAAGAVVASRLSEVPEWRVLLLEAGADETPGTQIPRMAPVLQTTPYNWAFRSVPQKTCCLGMHDHSCAIPAGRALGGSTAINEMVFTRGNKRDYDLWSDLGNDGWCHDDVVPYFKKIEDLHVPEFDRKLHNQGGPQHLENPQHHTPVADHFLAAGKELGHEIVDANGKQQLGFSVPQVTTKHGKRESVSQAYLAPAHSRKNLYIKPAAQVIKVVVSTHTKEASGVKYIHDGKLYVAKAAHEVILAAGAIKTAQLLMLSGIGPKEDLEKHEIKPVHDLPVGKFLKDHFAFLGLNFHYNESVPIVHDEKQEVVDYLRNGKGPLTYPWIDALAFLKTEVSKDKDPHYPDVEIYLTQDVFNGGHQQLRRYNFDEETYGSVWKPTEGHHGFSLVVVQTHPKSVGHVTLATKDPLHPPLVDSNMFSDPDEHDLATMVAGIKLALKLAHSDSLKGLGVHLNPHLVKGCEVHEAHGDDYWKCAVRRLSVSLGHVTGTARMGPDTDGHAVVDAHLQVHGVHKLRVVDGSVVPVSLTGHPAAAEMMVGEKAADLIKHHWK